VGNVTVSPGSSPGTLTINGNVPFSALGELLIGIFDDTPGAGYDLLSVSSIVDLGGTLRARFLPGAWVNAGEMFDIITTTNSTSVNPYRIDTDLREFFTYLL
jgi:hypothetical protein